MKTENWKDIGVGSEVKILKHNYSSESHQDISGGVVDEVCWKRSDCKCIKIGRWRYIIGEDAVDQLELVKPTVKVPDWNIKYIRGNKHFVSYTPAITLLYRFLEDNQVEYHSSICSPKDSFCKKVGREVALAKPVQKVYIPQGFTKVRGREKHENTSKIILTHMILTQPLSKDTLSLIYNHLY